MRKCCNPFNRPHTNKQHRSAKPINKLERCKKPLPNFDWNPGQELCLRCRFDMLKRINETKDKTKDSDEASEPAVADPEEMESNNEEDVGGDSALPVLPSAPAGSGIYPQLASQGHSSAQDVESGIEDVVLPVLPARATRNNYPQLPQEPCSSSQALGTKSYIML